ncbi:Matrixin [Rubripirellula lacrimiformis]|uniref:Matrixin n=1 Tax=Rubripirellula lacrimiformis TaxID=1930273 RepID=A0A517NA93_9BACT|nr:matrixin family metalloprotease [Rubripirellula lacrimiformis]QDT04056.1 Matrixin [Rubripirellula lacrimiformis]
MKRSTRRTKNQRTSLETLEARDLLAAFGTPWPEARDLSISFPADEVAIGEYENDIRQTLDAADQQQWQELALRAYQTWAIHADINVGLRNDFDVSFGAAGLMNQDPRFGEFRIGAFPQDGLMANSLPFQVAAGTYSGDLLLNSNQDYRLYDWPDSVAPDLSTWDEGQRDLFSVLLHEAGNTLGVDDNQMEWSVMFGQYTTPKGVLAPEDIGEIQQLYGMRSDPYESVTNDQLATATIIPIPIGFAPASETIRTRGSIASANDVDHFRFSPVPGSNSVTIRLNAEGISLLESQIEVTLADGTVVAQSMAASVFENDHQVELTGLGVGSDLFVKVTAADSDSLYSIGDYVLELDYRDAAVQSQDIVPGDYQSGADSLYSGFDLLDLETDVSTTASAIEIDAHDSIDERFEIQSSVGSASDVDVWKVVAPSTSQQRLIVSLAGVGSGSPDLDLYVVDDQGQSVGTTARLRPDGTWTVEVNQPTAGQEYFIRVSVDPGSAVEVGNYVAVAEFVSPPAQMNDLISGDVDATVDEFFRWTASKSKLFRFDFSAFGAAAGDGARLRIYDAHTHEIRLVIGAQNDMTRTGMAWLQQGDYVLRFTAFSADDQSVAPIQFTLTCDGISDDQDETGYDPDNDPDYDPYTYEYTYHDYGYYYSNYEYYYDWDYYYQYDGDPNYAHYYE